MSGHTSNAASEGSSCHSIAQLIMSESDSGLQTSMGDHILQMVVCLRHGDGKEAVGQLKAMYVS
jgi:hypothetical protein